MGIDLTSDSSSGASHCWTNKHSYQKQTTCPQLEPKKGLQQKQMQSLENMFGHFGFFCYMG